MKREKETGKLVAGERRANRPDGKLALSAYVEIDRT